MRAISIIIAAAIILTVNASTNPERRQEFAYRKCITALTSVSSSLDILTKDIEAITKDNLPTQVESYKLHYSPIKSANKILEVACCGAPSVVPKNEEKTLLYDEAKEYLTAVQSMLSSIQARKDVLTSARTTTSAFIFGTITDLEGTVERVGGCTVYEAPQTKADELNNQVESVQNSFKAASGTPSPPPSVPPIP